MTLKDIYNIDYSNGETVSVVSITLEDAVVQAEQYVKAHQSSRVTASIYDHTDKQVALVTPHVTQTLQTDPGY